MFSGSISINRVTVGLSPIIRQELFDEARRQGVKIPELIRYILLRWHEARK